MGHDYRRIMELIDRCYAAAASDDHWPSLLKDVRTLFNGHAATLRFSDNHLKPIGHFFADNISAESMADYRTYYYVRDIRMQRAIPGAVDRIVTDRDLVDDGIVGSHEFYQDFLRPIGLRYVVSAVMSLDQDTYAFCSVHRGLLQDHADGEIIDGAQLLFPHLRRSLQLRRRLSAASAQGKVVLDLLDGLGQGVMMIDSGGCIVWQNAWADRLLRQQDGLFTADGELRTLSSPANAELQRLVGSAIGRPERPEVGAGCTMTVPRPSMKRAYQLLVTSLPVAPETAIDGGELHAGPAAAIFIMDMEATSVPPVEQLRRLYDLTPAEARLATALGSGKSVKAYAEEAKLSIHYVRWLLKQVEAKTDTRRITDLIQLLAKQTGLFGAVVDSDEAKDT
jgi:DNA-binding CsgD family transcriptional regulator